MSVGRFVDFRPRECVLELSAESLKWVAFSAKAADSRKERLQRWKEMTRNAEPRTNTNWRRERARWKFRGFGWQPPQRGRTPSKASRPVLGSLAQITGCSTRRFVFTQTWIGGADTRISVYQCRYASSVGNCQGVCILDLLLLLELIGQSLKSRGKVQPSE